MKILLFYLILQVSPIESLTLPRLLQALEEQLPELQQLEWIQKSADQQQALLTTQYLPQVSLSAIGTYQSEVTEIAIPVPGFSPPSQPNLRVSFITEIEQSLMDGGRIRLAKTIAKLKSTVAKEEIQLHLYKEKMTLTHLYFGVLELDQRMESITKGLEILHIKYEDVQKRIDGGQLLSTDAHVLLSEIREYEKQRDGLLGKRRGLMAQLSHSSGLSFDPEIPVLIPTLPVVPQDYTLRPELSLMNAQQKVLTAEKESIQAKYAPQMGAFVQMGYSQPGLNMFENTFSPWMLGGIRAQWKLWNWDASEKEKQLLSIQSKQLKTSEAQWKWTVHRLSVQLEEEISHTRKQRLKNEEIVVLRTEIVAQVEKEVAQGRRLLSDYTIELERLRLAQLESRLLSLNEQHLLYSLALNRGLTL